jgi:hypothetical protein
MNSNLIITYRTVFPQLYTPSPGHIKIRKSYISKDINSHYAIISQHVSEAEISAVFKPIHHCVQRN